jgi:two-component system chemotaxis response regulator CheY
VISDWNMEPMSGLDFPRGLRADAALRATPFIMLTSADTQDSVLTAIQAGVTNYIVKPFAPNTLKAKIASVLGSF